MLHFSPIKNTQCLYVLNVYPAINVICLVILVWVLHAFQIFLFMIYDFLKVARFKLKSSFILSFSKNKWTLFVLFFQQMIKMELNFEVYALPFYRSQNVFFQSKNWAAFSASSKTVPARKPILLNANHPFVWHKMFVTATICKWIFWSGQKILGPVKEQGISHPLHFLQHR